MTQLEHTKLADITNSIQIYFDPDDLNTLIDSDTTLIQQYRDFQLLTQECNGSQNQDGADELNIDRHSHRKHSIFLSTHTRCLVRGLP